MTTPTYTAANVVVGPGALFAAPAGVSPVSPTDATTALASGWVSLGYTEQGFTIGSQLTVGEVEVAESFDPILYVTTKRITSIQFAFAEATAKNLLLTLNQGVVTSPTAPLSPAAYTAEVRVRLCYETVNGARWLFEKCYNTGNVQMARQKAPAKATIGVEFRAEIAASGVAFKLWPAADGTI